eukprot:TRINITY_DN9431_c0_g4_i1.p1 TRINITY_DN9431_c0_g4~~TRINITY_DN9431_c0_g4_i1.p1  ORF type:complete len:425 (+),score=83.82 TRINITY_DN9431_c0_g4_i1:52-1326(+)
MPYQTQLYDVLGVDPWASDSDIKRAYYDKARLYHPDCAGEGDLQRLHEVQDAYEILSCPGKKVLYDRCGYGGLRLLEGNRPDSFSVGPYLLVMIWFWSVIPVATQCVFITLRADGVVGWRWAVVFIPLWILSVLAIGFTIVTCHANTFARERRHRSWAQSFRVMLRTSCAIAFAVLLCLRLEDGDVYLSWPVVFIPLYIMVVVGFEAVLTNRPHTRRYYEDECAAKFAEATELQYRHHVFGVLASPLRDAGFVALLVMRLHEVFTATPYVIGIPQYVYCFIDICFVISKHGGDHELVVMLIIRVMPTVQLLLFFGYADSSDLTFARAAIPTWIVLALWLCLMVVMARLPADVEEEEDAEREATGEPYEPEAVVETRSNHEPDAEPLPPPPVPPPPPTEPSEAPASEPPASTAAATGPSVEVAVH